jgi:hypothetical protein
MRALQFSSEWDESRPVRVGDTIRLANDSLATVNKVDKNKKGGLVIYYSVIEKANEDTKEV